MIGKLERFTISTWAGASPAIGIRSGFFALHFAASDVAKDLYAVTHVPTGLAVVTLLDWDRALALFKECCESEFNWDFTSATAMPPEVRTWGRAIRAKYRTEDGLDFEAAS